MRYNNCWVVYLRFHTYKPQAVFSDQGDAEAWALDSYSGHEDYKIEPDHDPIFDDDGRYNNE